MAKKASAGASAGTGKKQATKPKPAKSAKPRKPSKPTASRKTPKPTASRKKAGGGGSASSTRRPQGQSSAADAVIKLLESPLMVDLIAVGATAALAAIAEQRFGRRDGDPAGASRAAKAAGKAAAAAMGRRIASEVEEILEASKKAKGDE